MITLGFDTSNYTTSVALYDSETGIVRQKKLLLPVAPGEKGLRQSDAVFHHTARLFPIVEELLADFDGKINAVGVSARPRDAEGSYMPCFSVGVNAAHCVAAALRVGLHGFSHQAGHLAAALYSAGRLELMKRDFVAFHVSGGTTEMLKVTPSEDYILGVDIIGGTLDLNAGQAVDRVGMMLGLDFPCGAQLERLALSFNGSIKAKTCVKDGFCSLSGLENQCKRQLDDGLAPEYIARYCIDFIIASLEKMTDYAICECGTLPLLYAGGVMSNTIIRKHFQQKYGAVFAAPEFSCDNAAGVAVLAYERCVSL